MKKLLAIMMAMVMVFALTIAVAADEVMSFTHSGEGWGNSDSTFTFDTLNDDDVVTFTMDASDLSAGWWQAGLNHSGGQTVLLESANPDVLSVSMTVAELHAMAGDSDWGYQLFVNCSGGNVDATVTLTVDAPSAAEPEPEAPAAEPEPEAPAAEPEAPAAEPAPAPAPAPSAPATGLALAVVPAVMALAAVAVSKKH